MTLKEAKRQAKENGISINKTRAGDYRVNILGDPEKYAVYEATVEDALDTAKYMSRNAYKRRR